MLSLSLLGQDAALEHAREVNLERARSMPNFVVDEISKRSMTAAGSSKWRSLDTIEAEITIHGTRLTRQNLRRNGKPWNRDSGFGFLPGTGFGAELKPLFDPSCPTRLEFAGREEGDGTSFLVYRFSSPPDACFSVLSSKQQPYNAARVGRVLLDPSTGRVVRFEEEAIGFPADYGFVRRNQVLSWGYVKTAGGSMWLPTDADFVWSLPNGMRYRVAVVYRNHRHFEAATTLSFADPPVPSPSSPAKSLDGVWRSQGSGSVYVIKGPQLTTFEVTATTCVPGISAARKAVEVTGRVATFQGPGGNVYFVRSGGEDDHKRLHIDGSASDIRIDRIEQPPEVCSHATADTPPDNFEIFTRTWAENYISFDLKQTDWGKVVAESRPKVTSQTTPAQLFEILAGMIRPFGDAHTSIDASSLKRDFSGFRPGTHRVMKGDGDQFPAHRMRSLFAITDRYLHGPSARIL